MLTNAISSFGTHEADESYGSCEWNCTAGYTLFPNNSGWLVVCGCGKNVFVYITVYHLTTASNTQARHSGLQYLTDSTITHSHTITHSEYSHHELSYRSDHDTKDTQNIMLILMHKLVNVEGVARIRPFKCGDTLLSPASCTVKIISSSITISRGIMNCLIEYYQPTSWERYLIMAFPGASRSCWWIVGSTAQTQ